MTTAAAQLAHLQRAWIAALSAPGGFANLDPEQIFAPPPAGTLRERLSVYAEGYRERLLETLRTEYPALHALLGDELFAFFARAYVAQRPPQSLTLYDLGAGFPAFLARTQRGRRAGGEQRQQLIFAVELARLERAHAEIVLAEGLENAAHEALVPDAALFGAPQAGLALPATTRVFLMHHGLDAFAPYLAHREEGGENLAPPLDADTSHAYIALWRHRYRVMRQELEPWQFYALRASASRPCSLIDCAAFAARRTGESAASLLAKLAFWLPLAQGTSLATLPRSHHLSRCPTTRGHLSVRYREIDTTPRTFA